MLVEGMQQQETCIDREGDALIQCILSHTLKTEETMTL
jgi:hypothetical protein